MANEKRGPGRPPSPETLAMRAAKAVLEQHGKPEPEKGIVGRTIQRIKNRYDASGMGRRMAGWNPPRTSPNTALRNLERIRERARDASRNGWAAGAAVQKWTTTVVGIGITPRFKRLKNKERKQAVVDLWNDFVQFADADGVLNLYGMQTLVVRTWFDGGECFARRRNRFDDEGLPVSFQIQLLEADMVPLLDTDAQQGLPEGHIIRSGIEFNKRRKRVAYWVYKDHPGENSLVYNGEPLVRVAASEMCHIYEPKRPGQLRGVSELALILANLREVEDYEDAVLQRQKIANLFVAFIKRVLPQGIAGGPDVDPLTNAVLDSEEAAAPLVPMGPGLLQELDDGQEVQFSNPPEAGTNYSEYLRTRNMGTAAGAGLPYELHAGDILNVSDRTLRIIMNEFRRLAEQRQWQVVIPMFCQPCVAWFSQAALLKGVVNLEEAEDVRRCEHAPHGWPDIHPTQDIEGRLKEVEGGVRSRSSVIGARGDDPDEVDEERLTDQKREKSLGIDPPPAAGGGQPAPAPAPKQPEGN